MRRCTSELPAVTVEVVSDAICPWCWIGKRRLEGAAALLAGKVAVRAVWKPFELNPGMPKEGLPRKVYRQRKFGSLEYSALLDAQVAEAGRAAGLDFRHDLMEWTPNTFDCHRLIRFAGLKGRQDEAVEGLFRAYFLEGRNTGDYAVMADVAAAAGLDRAEAARFLASGEGAAEIASELAEARALGIGGVPAFLICGAPAVAGTAPSEMIAAAIAAAARPIA
jgi:predicted DsbA family dithiol-disulfide isomerase